MWSRVRPILDWNLVTKFQALNSSGIQAFRFQSFLDWQIPTINLRNLRNKIPLFLAF